MKSYSIISFLLLSAPMLWAGLNTNVSTATMKVYEAGAEKLTVYTDVPGHNVSVINGYPSRARSDIYEIRVRSAATFNGVSNEWVQCFANLTYNRGQEMPLITEFSTPANTHAYIKAMSGWTHTYANIEMSTNTPVEVEVRKIGSTLLNSSNVIFKSAVHPAQKVSSQSNHLGRVYFTITNPCQVVIDINGQMDDHNARITSGPGKQMAGNPPVHAVAFYANPIMAKPVASSSNIIVTVTTNQSSPTVRLPPPDPSTYNTLVFAPGVHFIGGAFLIHPGRNYYIPGDAIVYGRMKNVGVPQNGYRSIGDRINIYGYGTLCGIQLPHYLNDDNNPEYPEWNAWTGDKGGDAGIVIEDAWDIKITGIATADPSTFNTKVEPKSGRSNDQSMVSWIKLHSWRQNGDGFGGYSKVEDSFFRPTDDCTYVRDWRRRCTFWKDSNANIFRFINYISGGLDDCDILYSRWLGNRKAVFAFESNVGVQPGPVQLNITLKNLRFHDKLSNPAHIIDMASDLTYLGVTYSNILFYLPLDGKSIINGTSAASYTGPVMFKNIRFQNGLNGSGPVKLTQSNYSDYFDINEFVDISIFEPALQEFTLAANAVNGSITLNPPGGIYTNGAVVTATAMASSGYQFTSWSGDASGTNNPLTVVMTTNQTITANFAPTDTNDLVVITITTVGTNDWVCPAGVTNVTVECRGGGGAAGSASSTATGTTQARSGGGAGGSYARKVNFAVTPGTTYKVIVGAGGVPVTSVTTHDQAEPGQTGGDSKFMDAALTTEYVKAVGGAGGRNALKTSGTTVNVNGGVGSTNGCLGDVVFAGGSGGNAGATESGGTGSGGGGGGAGDAGFGGSPTFAITAGFGGVSGGGNGGVGRGAVGPPQTLPTAPGGGGGGVVVATSGSTTVGAAGEHGEVQLTYTVTPEPLVNPSAPNLQVSVSGNTLSLAWPTNAGWTLLSNSVGLAATDQWFPYPDSANLTNVNIPLDPAQTNLFFKLQYPYP